MQRSHTIGLSALALVAAGFVAIRWAMGHTAPFSTPAGIGVWISAFFTLCIFSFLYKDNPLYRFAEALFTGISAAYWMVMGFWNTLLPNCFAKLFPDTLARFIPGNTAHEVEYLYLIPLIFGLLLLSRLIPKWGSASRYSLAFVVGLSAGLNFIRYIASDLLTQIQSTFLSLIVVRDGQLSLGESFSNTVMVIGVIASLFYFFFSKEHKGGFGSIARVGTYVLMLSFGAVFGYTVMGRIALVVGRFEYLLRDWLLLIS